MIRDPELRAAVEAAREGWDKREATNPGGQLTLARSQPPMFFCRDCGRRFFNKGWHAEACGSPDFEEIQ